MLVEKQLVEDLVEHNACMPGYECVKCGIEWQANEMLEEEGPIVCSGCGEIADVEIEGIGDLREDQLGKELGKYSWCANCLALTLNVPGITYGSKPLSEYREGKQVIITHENKAELFFACAECGKEQFWTWFYCCPRCDAASHYFVEATEPVYNSGAAMEFGGNPVDWSEHWKCRVCGMLYWIGNANY